MRIKIVELIGHQYFDDDYVSRLYTVDGSTDWDDVTDKDLSILRKWATDRNNSTVMTKMVIVTEPQVDIAETVKTYLAKAKAEIKAKEEAEAKKKAAADKRAKTTAAKQAAKEKALLDKLKEKYK